MIALCERWVDQLRTTENSMTRSLGEEPPLSQSASDIQRVLTQVTQARVVAGKLALRLALLAKQAEKDAILSEITDLQDKFDALP